MMRAPRWQPIAIAVACALVLWVRPVAAADTYSDDDLCRAIGATARASLQPRDRLFLEKKCSCIPGYGCGAPGSKRWREVKRRAAREIAKRAFADAEAAKKHTEEEAVRLRAARELEQASCERLVACLQEFAAYECGLLSDRMDAACAERGGSAVECMKRSQAVIQTKKCPADAR